MAIPRKRLIHYPPRDEGARASIRRRKSHVEHLWGAADPSSGGVKESSVPQSAPRSQTVRSIAVLGAIVFDEIVTHDGARIESFGGTIYNLTALNSLVDDNCTVLPFSNVGADRYDQVLGVVASMPHVATDGLRRTEGRLTHAQLVYRNPNYREEIVRHMMKPLTIGDLDGALTADGIMVNFVNGTELDLATLRALRKQTGARLYLDMHNIMVRFGEDGQKHYLPFDEWPEWVAPFDFVQMNEFECEKVLGVSPERPSEFLRAARAVVEAGPTAAIVTMGPEGVALAHRREGVVYGTLIPAAPVREFVDATGCGDAFSCGTFWNYLSPTSSAHGNPLAAAMAGALVGAVNCEMRGIGKLDRARNAAERLHEVSPELAEKVKAGWLGERLS